MGSTYNAGHVVYDNIWRINIYIILAVNIIIEKSDKNLAIY